MELSVVTIFWLSLVTSSHKTSFVVSWTGSFRGNCLISLQAIVRLEDPLTILLYAFFPPHTQPFLAFSAAAAVQGVMGKAKIHV